MSGFITRRCGTPAARGFFNNPSAWFAQPSLFEGFFSDAGVTKPSFPRIDVVESETELAIVAEVPGMKKDDIQVTVHDHTLTISGERKEESGEERDGFLRREIARGTFTRSFTLPETLDVDGINAKYENGFLRIVFPKLEQARPKKIEVKVR
ncbi:MAG: Hsp20/alpha crystallin family protein [Candidatus Zixiibacteriota bacterium]